MSTTLRASDLVRFALPALLVPLIIGVASAGPAPKVPKSTPQLLEKGKAAYTANCDVCHGPKGDGNGPAGAALNPKPRDFSGPFKNGKKPAEVFKTISEGLPGTAMAAFAHIPEADRWGIVYHVLSFDKPAKK